MPTYDYVCDACEHEFELFQSIKDGVKRKCPECGRLKLRRLFGKGVGVVFKGSGFYTTDYRSDSYNKRAAEDRKSSEASSSSSSDSGSSKDSTSSSDSSSSSKSDTSGSSKKDSKE